MKKIEKNIAIIGGGYIGYHLAEQFLNKEILNPSNITITRRNQKELIKISAKLKVNVDRNNISAIKNKQVIILSVRPQEMKKVIQEIQKHVSKNRIIISVAVGLDLKFYEKYFPQNPIFRIMPNPFLISNLGIIPYSRNKNVKRSNLKILLGLFCDLCEEFIQIKDSQMHLFTTLTSSSSAIFYYIFNSMVLNAKDNHLDEKTARKLILLSAKSAAEFCLNNNEKFTNFINKSCTPGGMTIEGLNYFKNKKIDRHIRGALQKITNRSKEISKQLLK